MENVQLAKQSGWIKNKTTWRYKKGIGNDKMEKTTTEEEEGSNEASRVCMQKRSRKRLKINGDSGSNGNRAGSSRNAENTITMEGATVRLERMNIAKRSRRGKLAELESETPISSDAESAERNIKTAREKKRLNVTGGERRSSITVERETDDTGQERMSNETIRQEQQVERSAKAQNWENNCRQNCESRRMRVKYSQKLDMETTGGGCTRDGKGRRC